MKTIVFLALLGLLCCVSARGQELELDSATNKLMYRRVVTVADSGATAGKLWERARQWMARAYKSADDVLQYENKEEGRLMGRGVWKEEVTLNDERMEHVIIIECKDGRVRCTFTDFVRETYDSTLGRQRKALEDIKLMKKVTRGDVAKKAAAAVADLEKGLRAASELKKKDDGW